MKIEVTLVTEQKATVVVETDDEFAADDELTRLALLELDKSGGMEWQTQYGWVDRRKVLR